MKRILPFVLAAFIPATLLADDAISARESVMIGSTENVELSTFLWEKRPIIVFADSPDDPRFAEQMALLNADLEELRDRDVVVLTDTDPDARSSLRLKLRPRGFMMALVGKDGGVKLRKPLPWTVREITRSIDKMPIRQREVEERRNSG
ncbi:MAG: DUF4174 domain-containing protein [Arenibacterium sp.]